MKILKSSPLVAPRARGAGEHLRCQSTWSIIQQVLNSTLLEGTAGSLSPPRTGFCPHLWRWVWAVQKPHTVVRACAAWPGCSTSHGGAWPERPQEPRVAGAPCLQTGPPASPPTTGPPAAGAVARVVIVTSAASLVRASLTLAHQSSSPLRTELNPHSLSGLGNQDRTPGMTGPAPSGSPKPSPSTLSGVC